jgi:hypothetical protein
VWNKIIESQIMVECVRPEVRTEVRAGQHRSQCVADCLVGPLTRSILIRRIRAGWFNSVTKIFEGFQDVTALSEFTAAVHPNVFIGTNCRIVRQPIIDPFHRRGLGGKCATIQSTTEMIGDQCVACFTIHADEVVSADFVVTSLHHEPKINGDSLITHG